MLMSGEHTLNEPRSLALLRELVTILPFDLNAFYDVPAFRAMDGYLSSALTQVQSHLNQAADINRFPPEILAAIFDYARRERTCEKPDTAESEVSKPDTQTLIAITHVCRRWRTVALDCSVLWTDIAIHSDSAQTFLLRAHDAPVSLSATVVRGQLPKTQKKLLWHLRPRIRSLHVTVASIAQLTVFRKLLRDLAGSLETLTIVVNNRGARRTQTPVVALSLFGGQAPALKSLLISSTYGFIPTDRFPVLVQLHLSRFQRGSFLGHLSDLLRNTPALETFHCHMRVPSNGNLGSLDWSIGSISLPSLRHFCVTGLPSMQASYAPNISLHGTIYPFLAKLILPHGARVTIQEKECCSRPFGALVSLFSPPVGPNPNTALTLDSHGIMAVTQGNRTYVVRYRHRITAPAIYGHYCPPALQNTNRFAGSEVLLRSVKYMRIQGSFSWSASGIPSPSRNAALFQLVGRTPFLTEFVLRDFKRELLVHLTDLLERADAILCPQLASLVYITLELPHGRTYHLPTSDILFRATSKRAERGYPLKRLTLCSPDIQEECTLQHAHGVEHIAILRRDVWSEHDHGDAVVDEHWRTVERRVSSEQYGSPKSGQYEDLWKKVADGEPLPERVFGAYGHAHKWP